MIFINLKLRQNTLNIIVYLIGIAIGLAISYLNKSLIYRLVEKKIETYIDDKAHEFLNNGNKKNFVLIAVMTADEFINTRSKASYITWGKELNGKIIFFCKPNSDTNNTFNIPLVNLPGVDDSYPPQKKAFTMFKYMYDNYLDHFEWFIRADDDVYIKTDELELFLRSLNSSKPYLIGQPGFGNKEEFGKLFLNEQESFCMGGPGVIFSKETLRRVGPFLNYCYKNLIYSYHEDVEFSRCINRILNISCAKAYDLKSFFFHIRDEKASTMTDFLSSTFENTISIHPLKDTYRKYLVHITTNIQKIKQMRQNVFNFKKEIDIKMKHLDIKNDKMSIYDYQDQYAIYSFNNKNPKRKPETSNKIFLDKILFSLEKDMFKISSKNVDIFKFSKTLYSYFKQSPYIGVKFIISNIISQTKLAIENNEKKNYLKQLVHLNLAFTNILFREENSIYLYKNANNLNDLLKKTINIIVPLSGRFNIFKRFLNNYENTCLKTNENTRLVVVLSESSAKPNMIEQDGKFYSQGELTANLIDGLRKKYSLQNNSLHLIVVNSALFSRAVCLQSGADFFSDNELIFFIDVDLVFKKELLYRIRLNTIKNKQVYFPIMFNQYNPKVRIEKDTVTSWYDISTDTGRFREFSFGMVSMYKKDFVSVGGFNTSIVGWGKEDIEIYEKFVKSKDIFVFRSIDPDLIHVYHEKVCDKSLVQDQFDMCLNSKSYYYASNRVLSYFYYHKFHFNITKFQQKSFFD